MGAVSKIPNLPNANTGNENCFSVALDPQDQIFCGGSSGTFGETNAGGSDAYVAKFDPSGNIQWIRQFGAVTRDVPDAFKAEDTCKSIALDGKGAIYCAGESSGRFAEANSDPVNPNSYDVILFKLNPDGTPVWKTQLGGVTRAWNSTSANLGLDFSTGIAVSADGKTIYTAGSTNGDLGEPNGSTGQDPNVSAAWYDGYVLKADAGTGAVIKIQQAGKNYAVTSSVRDAFKGNDSCSSLAFDPAGVLYCAGNTLGNMGEVNFGSFDYFIWKIGVDF